MSTILILETAWNWANCPMFHGGLTVFLPAFVMDRLAPANQRSGSCGRIINGSSSGWPRSDGTQNLGLSTHSYGAERRSEGDFTQSTESQDVADGLAGLVPIRDAAANIRPEFHL